MEHVPFGSTGLHVPKLGLGAGALGDGRLSELEAERLIHEAVDLGAVLFDTARSYGASEERLGRHLGARRRDVVLATKGGYGIDGVPDWTPECIARGIDAALARLRTDVLDVFHLHSCPASTLERGDLFEPLERARRDGKVRVVAYSGEEDALSWAVESGAFGSVECSFNAFDQRALGRQIARAAARGLGVIGKRPLANAPWRFAEEPRGHYCEAYWRRMSKMRFDPAPLAWHELALRFAAYAPGVSCVIVGTADLEHLRDAARAVDAGPLDAAVAERLRASFEEHDDGWLGQI